VWGCAAGTVKEEVRRIWEFTSGGRQIKWIGMWSESYTNESFVGHAFDGLWRRWR
jgi:hypothetical protein